MHFQRSVLVIVISALFITTASAAGSDTQKWTGSRSSPVHQIPLRDEFDQQIIPTETHPLPFSARKSCAPCHEYAALEGGLAATAVAVFLGARVVRTHDVAATVRAVRIADALRAARRAPA